MLKIYHPSNKRFWLRSKKLYKRVFSVRNHHSWKLFGSFITLSMSWHYGPYVLMNSPLVPNLLRLLLLSPFIEAYLGALHAFRRLPWRRCQFVLKCSSFYSEVSRPSFNSVWLTLPVYNSTISNRFLNFRFLILRLWFKNHSGLSISWSNIIIC